MGWGGVGTVYPAESWAPRRRAHEYQRRTDGQTDRQTDGHLCSGYTNVCIACYATALVTSQSHIVIFAGHANSSSCVASDLLGQWTPIHQIETGDGRYPGRLSLTSASTGQQQHTTYWFTETSHLMQSHGSGVSPCWVRVDGDDHQLTESIALLLRHTLPLFLSLRL